MNPEVLHDMVTKTMQSNARHLSPQQIADFCGLSEKTVAKWLQKKGKPLGGITAIQLWYFLTVAGYIEPSVMERVQEINPYGAYLGKLLAFRVISLEEAAKEVCHRNPNAVLRAARGENKGFDSSNASEPELTLGELHDMYDEQLQAAVDELRARVPASDAPFLPITHAEQQAHPASIETPPAVTTPQIQELPAHHTVPSDSAGVGRDFVAQLAQYLGRDAVGVKYLIEHGTEEERKFFRELLEDVLFKLSTQLNRLCSTRAYESEG